MRALVRFEATDAQRIRPLLMAYAIEKRRHANTLEQGYEQSYAIREALWAEGMVRRISSSFEDSVIEMRRP